MHKALQLFAVSAMVIFTLLSYPKEKVSVVNITYDGIKTSVVETTKTPPAVRKEISQNKSKYSVSKQETISELVYEPRFTDDDILLLAHLAIAESEGESEEGQRLVIDSVINRMQLDEYPDTIFDVIYQKYQYSCTFDGRMERCKPTEKAIQLVKEELKHQTNSDVIYFTAGQYSKYGEPLFKVGNHYFSSY